MILLIGNYLIDQQESMQRFARLLRDSLERGGFPVELLAPIPVLGRLKPSPHGLGKWLGYVDKFFIFPWILRWKIRAIQKTQKVVVHICDHSNAHYVRYLQDVPHLVTCNDVLALRSARGDFPQNSTSWTGRQYQRLILAGLRRASRIVCISGATREQLLEVSGVDSRVCSVVEMDLNYPFSPMEALEARDRVDALLETRGFAAGKKRPFLMHIGGNQWYKNRMGVLRLYSVLPLQGTERPMLVLAGEKFSDEMKAFILEHRLDEEVVSLVGCDNESVRALYSSAEMLLFPSLAEGFGWPIVEAQACGCAVLTSAAAPMSDIGGGSALYLPLPQASEEGWEPWAHQGAQLVEATLSQPAPLKSARRAEGLENAARFSQGSMMRNYLRIYGQLEGSIAAC